MGGCCGRTGGGWEDGGVGNCSGSGGGCVAVSNCSELFLTEAGGSVMGGGTFIGGEASSSFFIFSSI